MTVAYVPKRRLMLHHVTGTVIPEVSGMCAFTCALALGLCLVYNPIRKDVREGGKKTIVYHMFHDCDAFWAMLTTFVTFVLGFFNSNVFQRWWRLRELCGTVNGKTVDTALLLASYIETEEELNDLTRILWLAHALHVQSVASQRGPDADVILRLKEEGLIKTERELQILLACPTLTSSTPLSIVYGWFTVKLRHSLKQVEPSCHSGLLQLVQGNVSAMRGAAADCLMYLSTPVPLAYTHLVDVTVTVYVLMAPVGLVPRLLWMAVPSCFIVTLVFYGFMCVGKQMLNPFDSHQSDSFETNAFLRGTRMACLEVIAAVHDYPPRDEQVSCDQPERADDTTSGHAWDPRGTTLFNRVAKPGASEGHLSRRIVATLNNSDVHASSESFKNGAKSPSRPSPMDSPLLCAAELPSLPSKLRINDDSIFGHH